MAIPSSTSPQPSSFLDMVKYTGRALAAPTIRTLALSAAGGLAGKHIAPFMNPIHAAVLGGTVGLTLSAAEKALNYAGIQSGFVRAAVSVALIAAFFFTIANTTFGAHVLLRAGLGLVSRATALNLAVSTSVTELFLLLVAGKLTPQDKAVAAVMELSEEEIWAAFADFDTTRDTYEPKVQKAFIRRFDQLKLYSVPATSEEWRSIPNHHFETLLQREGLKIISTYLGDLSKTAHLKAVVERAEKQGLIAPITAGDFATINALKPFQVALIYANIGAYLTKENETDEVLVNKINTTFGKEMLPLQAPTTVSSDNISNMSDQKFIYLYTKFKTEIENTINNMPESDFKQAAKDSYDLKRGRLVVSSSASQLGTWQWIQRKISSIPNTFWDTLGMSDSSQLTKAITMTTVASAVIGLSYLGWSRWPALSNWFSTCGQQQEIDKLNKQIVQLTTDLNTCQANQATNVGKLNNVWNWLKSWWSSTSNQIPANQTSTQETLTITTV